MTATHLFRGTPSGEILDADGRVVGIIIKPGAMEWLNGEGDFECPPERYFRGAPPKYWWRTVFREKAGRQVESDWSQHAARVPERSKVPPFGWLPDDGGEVWAEGFNACLDAIKGAK